MTRIYRVTHGTADYLVRASNAAQALRHVTAKLFAAEVATQDDLVRLLQKGVKVEEAGDEPSRSDANSPEPASDVRSVGRAAGESAPSQMDIEDVLKPVWWA